MARTASVHLPTMRIEPKAYSTLAFHDQVAHLFATEFARLFRYLDRLSGDPDLAADIAQEAFVRLYARGTMPDEPNAWLISVAMNQYRNTAATYSRRRRLLSVFRVESTMADPPPMPGATVESDAARDRVRKALSLLPERERQLLLLRAESWSYHEIAQALSINEASVGTLLARAKRAFLEACEP